VAYNLGCIADNSYTVAAVDNTVGIDSCSSNNFDSSFDSFVEWVACLG
jgi:hypothetical protein